ncbi:RDD family protein [Pseudomonas fluvialis]|uniref:RDD family protein n=1 Tax=Pseudomonas fluvialis TaxID=1793966 RepID=UPI0035B0B48B
MADGFASEKAAIIITKSDSDTADKTVYDHIEIDTESKICLATDNEELTPVRLSTAQFWPRLWARCIDLTLCWLLGSVAAVILPDIRSIFPGVGGVITDLLLGMAFICSAVFLYEWQFVSRFGATPGKMLLGIADPLLRLLIATLAGAQVSDRHQKMIDDLQTVRRATYCRRLQAFADLGRDFIATRRPPPPAAHLLYD